MVSGKEPVTAEVLQNPLSKEAGEMKSIPAGEVLKPYASDGKSVMVFRRRGGDYVKVTYSEADPGSWPYLIDGMPENEVIPGIMYAG